MAVGRRGSRHLAQSALQTKWMKSLMSNLLPEYPKNEGLVALLLNWSFRKIFHQDGFLINLGLKRSFDGFELKLGGGFTMHQKERYTRRHKIELNLVLNRLGGGR